MPAIVQKQDCRVLGGLKISDGATPVWGPLRRIRLADEADDLLTTIRRINYSLPAGWPLGLEQKLLGPKLPSLKLEPATVQNPLAANIHYLHVPAQEGRRWRNRPPSEVAAQHLWERSATARPGRNDLLTASRLLGGKERFRDGRMLTTTFASGHYKEFVARNQVEPRLDRLLRRINSSEPRLHPLLHAVGVFFETTLIHPLSDGNGRLARLLFQVDLSRTIGLRAPIFPLGPACAANRLILVAAFLAWELDHNAQPMVDFITAALQQLVSMYLKGHASCP